VSEAPTRNQQKVGHYIPSRAGLEVTGPSDECPYARGASGGEAPQPRRRPRGQNALEQLSLDPSVWGDYSEAAEAIADRSITTVVETCLEDDDIKYVKFIEFAGEEAAMVLESAPIDDVYVVTLVKPPGSEWWLVWGLSQNYFPPASEIRGADR
jgi:hypothetical protein